MNVDKIVVYVPKDSAPLVRDAIGKSGGGRIGRYSNVTFTTSGTGRFKPEEGAKPTIGAVGSLEEVEEDRIEFVCAQELTQRVIDAIKAVHPYEEPVIDVWTIALR